MKVRDLTCEHCNARPAACVGRYDLDVHQSAEAACDECCGHGCEDGHCVRCTDDDPCIACGREDGSPCEALALLGVGLQRGSA